MLGKRIDFTSTALGWDSDDDKYFPDYSQCRHAKKRAKRKERTIQVRVETYERVIALDDFNYKWHENKFPILVDSACEVCGQCIITYDDVKAIFPKSLVKDALGNNLSSSSGDIPFEQDPCKLFSGDEAFEYSWYYEMIVFLDDYCSVDGRSFAKDEKLYICSDCLLDCIKVHKSFIGDEKMRYWNMSESNFLGRLDTKYANTLQTYPDQGLEDSFLDGLSLSLPNEDIQKSLSEFCLSGREIEALICGIDL